MKRFFLSLVLALPMAAETRVYIQPGEQASNLKTYRQARSTPVTDLIDAMRESCPSVTVTIRPEQANFILLFDRLDFAIARKLHNRLVLANPAGDVVYSTSARKLQNAVEDACEYIAAH